MQAKRNVLLRAIFSIGAVGVFATLLSGCSHDSNSHAMSQSERSGAQYAQQVINLGPGAQEACVSAGGLPALTHELNGSQTAVCQFANGKRCAANIIQSGACL